MLHLRAGDYRTMPWKNGGGTTTELVVEPPRLADDAPSLHGTFLYRVSIANVDSDGPFSPFPGCERHIMLLSGAGMTLRFPSLGEGITDAVRSGNASDARTVELLPFAPFVFSGDDPVAATRTHGPVRDFNLIVDCARAKGTLSCKVIHAPETLPCRDGTTCVVHLVDGHLEGAAIGDTFVATAPMLLTPRESGARVVIARVARSGP